ncbi:MAG: histidinol-phosphate transaminase [Parahaliea sp.]
MSRFWSQLTGELSPYVPGEQPDSQQTLVKINTNELPYSPSPAVLAAIASCTGDMLRRYPDPESRALRAAIGRRYHLSVDEVFVGNGSDEVLAHAFNALFKHEQPLLYPDISYSFYPVWASLYGISSECIPLAGDFSVDLHDYQRPNGGIVIPNPNAPTGLAFTLDTLRKLLQVNRDSVVLIDEAYVDFGGESAAALIPEFDNLLVVHTLSKSRGLAGLRVGYAMGQSPLIEGLSRVKNSFNSYPLDIVAQRAAQAAIEDESWLAKNRARIIADREFLSAGLVSLGFDVLPSQANFIFACHPGQNAAQLQAQLRDKNIIVRHFAKARINQYLRISIGTHEDCQRLLTALAELL